MGILASVFAGFFIAPLIPWLHRPGQRTTGWLLAAVLLVVAGYLGTYIPHVARGASFHVSYAWLPQLDVHLAFFVDGLSLFFALLVSGVGALVLGYSAGYITEHLRGGRFYAYMLMFTAAMLGLVLANNLLTLYIFFELTTLASYLLIAFEHDRRAARASARQALVITNVGGLALLAGLLLMGQVTESYEISTLLERGAQVRSSRMYTPILLLFLTAAFTKSAQFPFYAWLPSAMVAPTPVSAYLHSAAMVKAGIYLLARFAPVLGGTPSWTITVTAVGASTTVLGGWLALRYTDLKQILAYSTVMALGLLTMLLGIGSQKAVLACLLFVLVHACYKAALFMVAGAIDRTTGERDVRRLQGLRTAMPRTFAAALAAGASMAGLPPFIGFIGKELAYGAALETASPTLLITAAVAANCALAAAAGIAGLRPFLGTGPRTKRITSPPISLWLPPLILGGLGLMTGLVPAAVDTPLIAPAARAVLQTEVSNRLGLWHGITPELGLSLLTVASGAVIYVFWNRLRVSRPMRGFAGLAGDALNRLYHRTEYGVLRGARRVTAVLQHGILRYYLAVILAAAVVLVGLPVLDQLQHTTAPPWRDIRFYEATVAAVIVMATGAALAIRSRLGTVILLSTASFCITLIYIFFGAPDVALTRLLIESFTAILVVLAFIDLPDIEYRVRIRSRLRDGFVALLVGAVVTVLTVAVLDLPFDPELGSYYIQQSLPEAHGRNIVNTILVDFRGLDTLGEITVLATAGLSIYALIEMPRVPRSEHEDPEPPSQHFEPDTDR